MEEKIPAGQNFVIEFPDMDTCLIQKDPEYTWSEVFKAVHKKHQKKFQKVTGKILDQNKFNGKLKSMFVLFPNKFQRHKKDYCYYGWFKDENGIQHNVVIHEGKDKNGNPCLKGTIDYEWEKIHDYVPEKKAQGVIPDVFSPEAEPKKKRVLIPKKRALNEQYGPKEHKREQNDPLDSLPF